VKTYDSLNEARAALRAYLAEHGEATLPELRRALSLNASELTNTINSAPDHGVMIVQDGTGREALYSLMDENAT